MSVPVPTRDLYLQIIKNYDGPMMSVDEDKNQVKEAQDKVSLAQLHATQEPSKFVKPVHPLATVNPE